MKGEFVHRVLTSSKTQESGCGYMMHLVWKYMKETVLCLKNMFELSICFDA